MNCKLCGLECPEPSGVGGTTIHRRMIACSRCGTYSISDIANASEPDSEINESLHLLSAISRRQHESGAGPFEVTEQLLSDAKHFEENVRGIGPSSIPAKADELLRYIASKSAHPGADVDLLPEHDYPVAFCSGIEEFDFYLSYLKERSLLSSFGYLRRGNERPRLAVKLLAEGWERIEVNGPHLPGAKQVFVAMWFSDEVNDAFVGGIAALESETGYSMLRIDKSQFNEKICDRILAEIKQSRFLIADVTGHRHGVYFEAGYAMGLGMPVIWTCREDHLQDCHFDTRQYNHVVWSNPNELKERLRDRIAATIR